MYKKEEQSLRELNFLLEEVEKNRFESLNEGIQRQILNKAFDALLVNSSLFIDKMFSFLEKYTRGQERAKKAEDKIIDIVAEMENRLEDFKKRHNISTT